MEKRDYQNQIEQFLDKELSQEAYRIFMQALEQDAALEAATKEEILLRQAVEATHQEAIMRANIKKWRAEKAQISSTSNGSFSIYKLAIAASIAFFLGLLTFIYLPKSYSNEALMATNYQEDLTLTSGLKGNNSIDELQPALAHFEAANYTAAIQQFKTFPNNDKAIYALGHSYYLNKEYALAIQQFQKVMTRQHPEYMEKAEWYLLLAYIGNDQLTDEFYALLDKTIVKNGRYSADALKLKNALHSFWRRD